MKKAIWIASSILVLLIMKTVIYQAVDNPLLFPSSKSIGLALIEIVTSVTSLSIIASSLLRLVSSIFLSATLAIILGLLSGFKKSFALFVSPYITILRTVPVISVVVIILVLFGFAYTPFIITFLMVFPLVYQGVYEGMKQLDSELIDVYRLEKNNFSLSLKLVYFPLIKKNILVSFLQSFGLGIKVLVMAEFLGQSRNSIGNAIFLAKTNLNYDFVFAWTILLILVSFLIEYGVKRYQNVDKRIERDEKK